MVTTLGAAGAISDRGGCLDAEEAGRLGNLDDGEDAMLPEGGLGALPTGAGGADELPLVHPLHLAAQVATGVLVGVQALLVAEGDLFGGKRRITGAQQELTVEVLLGTDLGPVDAQAVRSHLRSAGLV